MLYSYEAQAILSHMKASVFLPNNSMLPQLILQDLDLNVDLLKRCLWIVYARTIWAE